MRNLDFGLFLNNRLKMLNIQKILLILLFVIFNDFKELVLPIAMGFFRCWFVLKVRVVMRKHRFPTNVISNNFIDFLILCFDKGARFQWLINFDIESSREQVSWRGSPGLRRHHSISSQEVLVVTRGIDGVRSSFPLNNIHVLGFAPHETCFVNVGVQAAEASNVRQTHAAADSAALLNWWLEFWTQCWNALVKFGKFVLESFLLF